MVLASCTQPFFRTKSEGPSPPRGSHQRREKRRRPGTSGTPGCPYCTAYARGPRKDLGEKLAGAAGCLLTPARRLQWYCVDMTYPVAIRRRVQASSAALAIAVVHQ
jgi:hypothetical protein